MTWTDPAVYVPGQVMTSGALNAIGGNFSELWPYTAAGQIAYTEDSNEIGALDSTTGYRGIWSFHDTWLSGYKPRIGVYILGSQLQDIPDNEYPLLTYTSIIFEIGGDFVNLSVNAGRINIPIAGYYRVNLICPFAVNNTGIRAIYINRYGSVDRAFLDTRNAVHNSTTHCNLIYTGRFEVGDYIETNAYQNSGVTITTSTSFSRKFQVLFLGA